MVDQMRAFEIAHDYLWENDDPAEKPTAEEYLLQCFDNLYISLRSEVDLRLDVRGHDVWQIVEPFDLPGVTIHNTIVFVDSVTGEVWMLGEPRPVGVKTHDVISDA